MRDLIVLASTFGFFALCVAFVALCDRVIGPDPVGGSSEDSDASTEVTTTATTDAPTEVTACSSPP